MMIRVIYSDKSAGKIADHRLDELIAAGRIVAFYRADGWVSLERGPRGALAYWRDEAALNVHKERG